MHTLRPKMHYTICGKNVAAYLTFELFEHLSLSTHSVSLTLAKRITRAYTSIGYMYA